MGEKNFRNKKQRRTVFDQFHRNRNIENVKKK